MTHEILFRVFLSIRQSTIPDASPYVRGIQPFLYALEMGRGIE